MRVYEEAGEPAASPEPNTDVLRQHGWTVNLTVGRYCYAWRGHDEALFVWRGPEGWAQVPGRGRQAA